MVTSHRARPRRRLEPTHWALLGAGLVVLLVSLLLTGYTSHDIGSSSTQAAATATGGAAAIPGGGPVIDRSNGRLISRGLPRRTVALTFDDGPDPTWTPRILAVLKKARVPATFFVVGSRVVAHPGLVRDEINAGQEVGSHTFSHADLSSLPTWRADLQLRINQLALAGGAGVTTSLLRPPYSSIPNALTTGQIPELRRATREGYVVVLANRDSEDWRRPGAAAITRNALGSGDTGAIILFHDAGGDRSQTVAALPRIIEKLKQRGYRFSTVSGALGLPPMEGVRPVGFFVHMQGLALRLAIRAAAAVTWLITWLLVPLCALALLRAFGLLLLARQQSRSPRSRPPDNGWRPLVSVIVPAFNEAVGIEATVRSVASSDYAHVEVIVVDDGSTDGTGDIVESLGLPNVRVIRQANSGKPAALNTGIAYARYDVIVMIDGDTVFDRDSIRWLVQPLRDERVGAVSGNTKVGNRRGLLGRWQHIEYVIGFNLDRRMYDLLRCIPTVPGAMGAYARAALLAVGGVSDDTLAEDTDLTMSINRAGWRVVYEGRAVGWTEAPTNLGALWRQRYRWSYGTLQAAWKHRGAVRSHGSSWQLGRIGLPYLLGFQFLMPLLAPAIDLYALYGLVFLNPIRTAAIWLGFLVVQLGIGAYALHLDKERLRTLWSVPLQQFVYRQMMYAVVVHAVLNALSGVRLRWHKVDRNGQLAQERLRTMSGPLPGTTTPSAADRPHATPVRLATSGSTATVHKAPYFPRRRANRDRPQRT